MSNCTHLQTFSTDAPSSPLASSIRWSPNKLRQKSIAAMHNLSARVIRRTKSALLDVPQRSVFSTKESTSSTSDHRIQRIFRARSLPNLRPDATVTTLSSRVTPGGTGPMTFPERPAENIAPCPHLIHGVQVALSVDRRSSNSSSLAMPNRDYNVGMRSSEGRESKCAMHPDDNGVNFLSETAKRPPSQNDWQLDPEDDGDDDFWASISEAGDESSIRQKVPASSEAIYELLNHVEACQDDTERVLSDLDMDPISSRSPCAELRVQSRVNHGDSPYSCYPNSRIVHSGSTLSTSCVPESCRFIHTQFEDAHLSETSRLPSLPNSARSIHPLDRENESFLRRNDPIFLYFFVYIPMASRHAARPRVPLNRHPVRQTLADSFTFDILDVLSTAEDRTVLLDEFPPFSWSEFFSLDKTDQKVPPFPEDRYSSVFADQLGALPVSALRHPLGSSKFAMEHDDDSLPFLVTIPTGPRMKLVAKERMLLQAWLNCTSSKWAPLQAPWAGAPATTFPSGQRHPDGRTRIPQRVQSPRIQADTDSSPTSETTDETARSSPIIDALRRRQAKAATREVPVLGRDHFERLASAQAGPKLPIGPSRIARPVRRLQSQTAARAAATTSRRSGLVVHGIPTHPSRDVGSSFGDYIITHKLSRTSPSTLSSKITRSSMTMSLKRNGMIASTTRCTASSGLGPTSASNDGGSLPDGEGSSKFDINHDPWAFIRDIDATQSRSSEHGSRTRYVASSIRRSSGDYVLNGVPTSVTPKGILKKSKYVRFEGVAQRTIEGPVEDFYFSADVRTPSPFPRSSTHAGNLSSLGLDMDAESHIDHISESGHDTGVSWNASIQQDDEEGPIDGLSFASLESETNAVGCSVNLRVLPLRVNKKPKPSPVMDTVLDIRPQNGDYNKENNVNEAHVTPQQPTPQADESPGKKSSRRSRMRWASFDASESTRKSSGSSSGGLPKKMSLTPLRNIFKLKAT
ncbi:hypothetical protein CONPUDRAFT_145391 [Coniophora puteana RWD-64-598 SS2]|uniref:Uncharacterized protein n=1 Tax=Coniophora puteana (strain RWD-64-598) TaxID=741705 RepID=A0A5M3MJ99_CONPW|nr:uncharacterized protein CONPUDRAFT_145391 [Coniophora puteana RWD-64-598 SS2]EIW79329.1 hypothetical protein CONPUDRAFT_145391 [Coniophora puteana RWD-64-598 SS2]